MESVQAGNLFRVLAHDDPLYRLQPGDLSLILVDQVEEALAHNRDPRRVQGRNARRAHNQQQKAYCYARNKI